MNISHLWGGRLFNVSRSDIAADFSDLWSTSNKQKIMLFFFDYILRTMHRDLFLFTKQNIMRTFSLFHDLHWFLDKFD